MQNEGSGPIGAVVAAAGLSRRMGTPKQLLPWRDSTVINATVANLATAGAEPIVVVLGHRYDEIAAHLAASDAIIVYNRHYADSEMLCSYQLGIVALEQQRLSGVLLALGDQPHIPVDAISAVLTKAQREPDSIVIPSHRRRRGHPIYLPLRFWPALTALLPTQSLRDLLGEHESAIRYVELNTAAIRQDMDTRQDYQTLFEKYGT